MPTFRKTQSVSLGRTEETDMAQAIQASKVVRIGIATEVNSAGALMIKLRTRLILHWAEIALDQERQAHAAREAHQAGAPTEEMHASMLAAAAAAAVIDALYGEVGADAGVPADLRRAWRRNDTARHVQIFETIKRGFRAKPEWSGELEWLFRDQRNAALHATTEFDAPQAHPVAGHIAREYVIYSAENARRAVDIMLDVLTKCVDRPKQPLAQWATETQTRVEQLVSSRG